MEYNEHLDLPLSAASRGVFGLASPSILDRSACAELPWVPSVDVPGRFLLTDWFAANGSMFWSVLRKFLIPLCELNAQRTEGYPLKP
jgi:hypothetical protein